MDNYLLWNMWNIGGIITHPYPNLSDGLVKPPLLFAYFLTMTGGIYSFPPGQNGRHFANDIFKYISMNEMFRIAIRISLMFVPDGPIDNTAALVKAMAWRRTGDKPLPEPMLTQFTDAYRPTSNIRGTRLGNKFADHSDVVGASPVGVTPTTSSLST